MAIELTTVPIDTIDINNDLMWFQDVSDTPDQLNALTPASLLGVNLVDIRGLADPNVDSIPFWDDSAGHIVWLSIGANLSITGTTIAATGGGGGITNSAGNNVIMKSDGTNAIAAAGVTQPAGDTLKLTSQNATDIALDIVGAASQSGNYIQCTTNGGTAGDRFAVQSSGRLSITERIIGTGSGNYIAWGDTAFGDVAGAGHCDLGVNGSKQVRCRDNSGNVFPFFDPTTKTFGAFHGANVASAGTIAPSGNSFHVTGTTTITTITGTGLIAGTVISLIFDSTAQVTDGSNLKLAGNFTGGADRTLTLRWDGTNFYEMGRSTN